MYWRSWLGLEYSWRMLSVKTRFSGYEGCPTVPEVMYKRCSVENSYEDLEYHLICNLHFLMIQTSILPWTSGISGSSYGSVQERIPVVSGLVFTKLSNHVRSRVWVGTDTAVRQLKG